MKLLGAVLAGGQSVRFGADKALAVLDGRALISHVIDALAPQVSSLAVVGREWPGLVHLADHPEPHLGPLGGLCAALIHGANTGYDAVLTAGCDTVPVPDDLVHRLGHPSAVVEGVWTIGLWSCALAERLEARLADGSDRSIRGWLREAGARMVRLDWSFHNINTPSDLKTVQASHSD